MLHKMDTIHIPSFFIALLDFKRILTATQRLSEGGRHVAVMSDQLKQSSVVVSGISRNQSAFVTG